VSALVGDLGCVDFGTALFGEGFEMFMFGEGCGAFGFFGFAFCFFVFGFGLCCCCFGERSVGYGGGGICADGEVWFGYGGLEDIWNGGGGVTWDKVD